jgi:hypothetical protein
MAKTEAIFRTAASRLKASTSRTPSVIACPSAPRRAKVKGISRFPVEGASTGLVKQLMRRLTPEMQVWTAYALFVKRDHAVPGD